MARTVADAAAVLTAIAGSDPGDPATREADAHRTDYLAALKPGALAGVRIGVVHGVTRSAAANAAFADAQAALKRAGAVLVDVKSPDDKVMEEIGDAEGDTLRAEFKASLNDYLASTPPAVKARTLDALIAFDRAEPREMALFGQELFEDSAKAPAITDPAYVAKRAKIRGLARDALDHMLADNHVEALIAPTGGPAWLIDPIGGDRGAGSPTTLPAVAGYPHLTVPMGQSHGLPIGLSFIGPAWSEAKLLSLGYGFEQATHARINPTFVPSVAVRPEIAAAYDPR
jgi:amidase